MASIWEYCDFAQSHNFANGPDRKVVPASLRSSCSVRHFCLSMIRNHLHILRSILKYLKVVYISNNSSYLNVNILRLLCLLRLALEHLPLCVGRLTIWFHGQQFPWKETGYGKNCGRKKYRRRIKTIDVTSVRNADKGIVTLHEPTDNHLVLRHILRYDIRHGSKCQSTPSGHERIFQ